MPSTPIYGFPFEEPSEQPGITLHGGVPPSSEILAEEVEEELSRIESTVISDIESRLVAAEAAIEASKWRNIDGGVESGAAFTIAVPAGFELLRLYLLGDLDGSGTVRLRINGDSTAGLHEAGMLARDAADNLVDSLHTAGATTAWLANWGTVSGNTCELTVFALNAAGAPSWRSEGVRHSGNATGNIRSWGWGHTTADRTVSSLNIRPFSDNANQFATCHWRLEGRLV